MNLNARKELTDRLETLTSFITDDLPEASKPHLVPVLKALASAAQTMASGAEMRTQDETAGQEDRRHAWSVMKDYAAIQGAFLRLAEAAAK